MLYYKNNFRKINTKGPIIIYFDFFLLNIKMKHFQHSLKCFKQTCPATNSIIWPSDMLLPSFLTTYAIGYCPASSSGYLIYLHKNNTFKGLNYEPRGYTPKKKV